MVKYGCILFILSLLMISFDLVKSGEQKLRYDFLFAEKFIIKGPRCFPLLSKNVDANPYHSALLSKNHANTREGYGLPVILDKIICPHDLPEPCDIRKGTSFSKTISNSYSINLGHMRTFSKGIGKHVFFKFARNIKS